MKRSLAFALTALALAAGCCLLAACARTSEVPDKVVESVEGATSSTGTATEVGASATGDEGDVVAFVCESGDVDVPFNAQIWDGVQKFAKSRSGYAAKSYTQTGDATAETVSASMAQAIDDGAKVVVCAGPTAATALPSLAAAHSDVAFLLMDAVVDGTIPKNVHCVTFDNVQAGYLAGYALVADGYRGLGFVGGKNETSVSDYGFGFVQGANDAAVKANAADDMYLAYWYTGTYAPSDTVQSEAARWFGNGVDVEFSCAGSVQQNVIAAAEGAGKQCIVADADASTVSTSVLFAAAKNLSGGADEALNALAKNKGTWADAEAGTVTKLGIAEGGVGLSSTAGWRLKTFSQANYNDLFASIKSGSMKVNEDTAASPNTQIQVDMK